MHWIPVENAEAIALTDPDNQPMTLEQLCSSPRMLQIRLIRRALRLTQEEFAARYRIPLGILRDWEQNPQRTGSPARAHLKVIAVDPAGTAAALLKGVA
ncbi:helix-turn-helix domain-containing protein [Agrobacterium sp. rho-8.1]|nr:transcriptional regulator [Agrobacterium sp. rho-8.1]